MQSLADGSLELQVGDGQVAVFDLDRTLVAGSSLIYLARRLAGAGLLRRRTLALRTIQNIGFSRRGATDAAVSRVQSSLLALAAGVPYDALAPVIPLAADDVVAHSYAQARAILDRHRAAGDFCVIVSASPQELVEAVAQRIGAHRAVGTTVEVVDGVLTGHVVGPFCYGDGKLARMRDELGDVDFASVVAYADSRSDLPLLEAAGVAVPVNPDRRLAAVATARGWPALNFSG